MGPIGSPFSKVGVELTDSIYVVLNMDIMTRMGQQAFDQLGETSNDFVRGLHSKAQMDEENRYIVQFPEDNTCLLYTSRDRAHWHDCPAKRGRRYRRAITRRLI